MIFDPTTCCACAAVQELQGEVPLTLSGEGLWAGVLSSGQCVLECPGSQSAAGSSGDLLLGFGTFTLRPVTPCHLLCVRLTGLAVQQFLAGLPQPRFADGASCPSAAELLARVCGAGNADDAASAAAPYTLLCALAHGDEESRRLSPLVARAVEAIRDNYMALYGVEELSAQLGVSKCHLVRVFSSEMGMPPGRFLTNVRIEAAKLLLAEREYSLEMIAGLCGFSGANYLCRVFKRETGLSPAAWRETAAHKAAKPMDVTDAEDEDSEDIGDDLPEDDVAALDPDADILPEGDTLPAPSQQHLPSLSSSKDSLHLYLREVSRFPMLKPDEEFDLARRVQKTGDSDAAFRLVSSHLRLVVKIAMDFQRRWMQNVLDLIQEGNVGLMRAVNKFDPDKGIKFSYYAAFWIRAYILKFIMDNWRMVKIGTTQAQRKLFYNLNRERQKLIAEGFDPDAATLAERLGVGEDQIVEMQQRLDASDMSLDATVGDESGSATRMDFLPALGPGIEESLAGMEIAELLQSKIRDILPSLSEKEAYILEHRLLTDDPVTLREIGERYNVTRERVRQLEARLLQKLKTHLSTDIQDFSEDWISH